MFKFKLGSFFLLFLIFGQCKSLETQDPFFNSPSQENFSSDFKINLVELGFYRKVNNDWWGEDFYVVTLEVNNLTRNFRFFNICDDKLTEENFDRSAKRSEFARYYETSPARFEKNDFLVGFPEMRLLVEISNPKLIPTATYGGKPLFPKVSGNIYAAAMTSCQYGVPMSRDTDDGRTTTGWLAQNGGKGIIRAIYSVPAGAKLLKLEQPNIFSANLRRFEKQK